MDNRTIADELDAGHARLARWAAELEERTPADILAWAAEQYADRLTFATGFGPEGCVLIDLIGRHGCRSTSSPSIPDCCSRKPTTCGGGWKRATTCGFRSVTPELAVADQAAVHGDRLWERQPEHCCNMRKVVPLKAELARVDAWITAIRREQTPQRAGALVVEPDAKFGIVKVNPLVRWTKRHVWAHILEHDVPYNPLHDNGYPSIGCAPCTSAVKPGEDERARPLARHGQDRMRAARTRGAGGAGHGVGGPPKTRSKHSAGFSTARFPIAPLYSFY